MQDAFDAVGPDSASSSVGVRRKAKRREATTLQAGSLSYPQFKRASERLGMRVSDKQLKAAFAPFEVVAPSTPRPNHSAAQHASRNPSSGAPQRPPDLRASARPWLQNVLLVLLPCPGGGSATEAEFIEFVCSDETARPTSSLESLEILCPSIIKFFASALRSSDLRKTAPAGRRRPSHSGGKAGC